eukprot:XP_020401446.1 aspartyl protease family protein 1 [Zea mays]
MLEKLKHKSGRCEPALEKAIVELEHGINGLKYFVCLDPRLQVCSATDTRRIKETLPWYMPVATMDKRRLVLYNFMSGLKVVFDRERKVLGWKNFDCYSVGNSRSNLPVNPNPSGVPPAPGLGPNSYTHS